MDVRRRQRTVVIARKHSLNSLISRVRKHAKKERKTVPSTQVHMISDILELLQSPKHRLILYGNRIGLAAEASGIPMDANQDIMMVKTNHTTIISTTLILIPFTSDCLNHFFQVLCETISWKC